MHVFVTGGTGTIGTAVVAELLAHGHTVLGLARSDASATTLDALPAQSHCAAPSPTSTSCATVPPGPTG